MTFQIHRGGQARTVKGRLAKARIRQDLHGVVIQVQGNRTISQLAATVVHEKQVVSWWTDLRRGHLPVYGALLRFIDTSVRVGAPKEILLVIPRVIESYILDLYDEPKQRRMSA